MNDVVVFVVLVVFLVAVVAMLAWTDFGPRPRETMREQLARLEPAEDPDVGLVTYRQVAELLPRDVVEDVERALAGRRPVLDPTPARVTSGRVGFGGYPRQIVHHVDGSADVIE